ncbi:exodeoxyribonuclease 1 [Massarina eburnea CBS 473.64]|uniref:Exodeoxyribonuclease 1 n=1 Tax=Massarina eburnea CBS 473.64 TaxID=1395130 RepID=A0A6A6S093_9PLEO|nr:exodeoxyribonuclease 1 [Massarina eburnea CBS 473.64]
MGISGLLPLLKSIQKPGSLKKYAGQTIGVDAYGWLHRGTVACAIDLAEDKPTTKFVNFAMHRVRMLIHFGITPYIVFDGDYLPSKAGTEKDRAARRKEGKRLGLELLKVGKTAQAHLELQKAVDVTPEMARMLIEELKHHNIQYIVAPYEADSQMAYLERKGLIDAILTEDSDLLVFGAKCLITKLDKYGECVEINRNLFTACREVSLVGWSDADFRRMAILSGCDYLPSPGGMGLKTAYRMLRKHKTVDRLIKAAQFDGKIKIPTGYLEAFYQAENTFLYQWVFCPVSKQLVNLTAPEHGVDVSEMFFIGEEVPADIALGVARGDLHPHTKQPLHVRSKVAPSGKPLKPAGAAASTTAQTPVGKNERSIDSFFKPKRTPLAELDINLFTPSPSQQVLLEQQRRRSGWEPVPAPQPSTAPQPARRAFSDSFTARRTAPMPPRRQRLCTDSAADTRSAGNGDVTRSRFFATPTAEPSPSLRTNHKSKKKSRQSFELYSDDSIEDAMNDIVDIEEALSQPRKKMKVFGDSIRSSMDSDSQSSIFSRTTAGPSQDSDTLTPATSYSSPEPDSAPNSGLSKHVEAFRSKFAYDSGSPSSASPSIRASTSTRSTRPYKRAPSSRLSQLVTDESQEVNTEVSVAHEPHLQHDSQAELIEDSAWADMDAEVIVPASSPTGPPTPLKPSLSSTHQEVRGSEELIVSDSDAESICSPRKPLLNLGRFAFSG